MRSKTPGKKGGDFSPPFVALGRERSENRTPVVVAERVTLVALHQQVVCSKVDLHICFKLNALHVGEAVNVCKQEPSLGRGQEVVDHIAFRQAASGHHDRVHIVVCRARAEFRLRQTDSNRFESGRDNELTRTREDLQASLIAEVGTNGDHCVEQGGLIEFNLNKRLVRNRATIDRVVRGAECLAVTTDRSVVRFSGVEDVGAVDFLGLMERFHKAEVRRMELRLIEVVVDGFARNRIAKSDFSMLLVIDVAFASAVIESGLAAFRLQLCETEVTHFSCAFQRHLRVMLREDFVVLRRNLFVLADHPTEAGEEQVFNSRKINSHWSLLLSQPR